MIQDSTSKVAIGFLFAPKPRHAKHQKQGAGCVLAPPARLRGPQCLTDIAATGTGPHVRSASDPPVGPACRSGSTASGSPSPTLSITCPTASIHTKKSYAAQRQRWWRRQRRSDTSLRTRNGQVRALLMPHRVLHELGVQRVRVASTLLKRGSHCRAHEERINALRCPRGSRRCARGRPVTGASDRESSTLQRGRGRGSKDHSGRWERWDGNKLLSARNGSSIVRSSSRRRYNTGCYRSICSRSKHLLRRRRHSRRASRCCTRLLRVTDHHPCSDGSGRGCWWWKAKSSARAQRRL
jgi:hypothetical protein